MVAKANTSKYPNNKPQADNSATYNAPMSGHVDEPKSMHGQKFDRAIGSQNPLSSQKSSNRPK